MYKGLADALLNGERNPASHGKRICLPSSYVGSARYMIQNYQDAMAICRWFGYPNLLVTFTCNPKWPEVVRFLQKKSLQPEDRPDIMCRIFKAKLDILMNGLREKKIFGPIRAVIYTIEWQKRGLPHVYIIIWLENDARRPTVERIDNIILAEIPDESVDPHYYNAVKELMIHGPCGKARPNSPYMFEGRCTKYFPKKFNETTSVDEEGYPNYKRPDNGRTIDVKGITLDNRYVVPHNHELLMEHGAHINVEWCNQSKSIKYLCKYVSKGNDMVTAKFCETVANDSRKDGIDEIKTYLDCRYILPCEAIWRLLGNEIHYRNPPVERLAFHLPGEQSIVFEDDDEIEKVLDRLTSRHTMFLAWMDANKGKCKEEAKKLTYVEFPTKFVWKPQKGEREPRKKDFKIGRIFYVATGQGELYYLRTLLNVVRGPTSFEDIRRVNDVQYEYYKDACYALGLLNDDKKYIDGIKEASHWGSGMQLRGLFVTLLMSGSLSRPEFVLESCFEYLSEDILYMRRRLLGHEGLQLSDEEIMNCTILEIEKILRSRGKGLRDFPTMPCPEDCDLSMFNNRLILDELDYDKSALADECKRLLCMCNHEQRIAYDTIIQDVEHGCGGVYFLYGSSGTCKTFLWRILSAALRSKGDIILNVASNGIASLLLPGGRTGHSRFAIPLSLNEESTCNIK